MSYAAVATGVLAGVTALGVSPALRHGVRSSTRSVIESMRSFFHEHADSLLSADCVMTSTPLLNHLGARGQAALGRGCEFDVVEVYCFDQLFTWPTDQPRHATLASPDQSIPIQAQFQKTDLGRRASWDTFASP